MKLTDKQFWIFEALSLVCGEVTFCITAGIWFVLSQVNWFSEWIFQLPIVLCWGLGALFSWLTSKSINNITLRTYIWTNCVYLALTIYNVSNGDESIDGWYIMFCLGFAILSLPAFVLMTIIYAKIKGYAICNGIPLLGKLT